MPGSIQRSVTEQFVNYLITFLGERWPSLKNDPLLLTMLTGFFFGGVVVWFVYWLVHKGKINGLNATIASLQGEKNILERQKADLESRLKESIERKAPTEQKPTVTPLPAVTTPLPLLSSNEIIHPSSSNGVLWKWDGEGADGPFCPTHGDQLFYKDFLGHTKPDVSDEAFLGTNGGFVCPTGNEEFNFFKPSTDRIRNLREQATTRLRDKNHQLQPLTPISPPSGLFEIEQHKWELHWRAKGEKELHPFHSEIEIPSNAALVLQIKVEITAIPALLVEDVGLELSGQCLSDRNWESRKISKGERFLYFDIPPLTPSGKHGVRLTVRASRNGSGIMVRKSQDFTVVIARSYSDFQRFSGTS